MDLAFNFDNTYKDLPNTFYTNQEPAYIESPKLVISNNTLANEIGLKIDDFESEKIAKILSGNTIPKAAYPISQAYAGHQFGYFTMLGDGRAVLLGEHIGPNGTRYDVQLKGSGRTAYSRAGDGKASLGPMLREYIISEAMHYLNIPSARSLAVVETGEEVIREKPLPGAILTRIASSHIRVGTFEYLAAYGAKEEVKILADYTIKRHFNQAPDGVNPYIYLLQEVIKKQAKLISKWQLVGFVHGVMNTDNMAISGETIDYGPCAFMDAYNPDTVFSSIDRGRRYAYSNQSNIALWNLSRFSETLLALIEKDLDKAVEIAEENLSEFPKLYKSHWLDGMRKKLGLFDEEEIDEELIDGLLDLMNQYKADYTNTFLALTFDKDYSLELMASPEFKDWRNKWESRVRSQNKTKEEVLTLMKENNPSIIPRNHLVENALENCIDGDYSLYMDLLEALTNPFGHTKSQEQYQIVPCKQEPYLTYCGT